MHVQLSTEEQSHAIPQGGAPVSLGMRYTSLVGHRLVCPLVLIHQGCTTARSLMKSSYLHIAQVGLGSRKHYGPAK